MTIYLDHFGLDAAPFKITPHTEFFFAGANRGETLEALIYAITSGEGIVKVVGEVGSGKTMLCRVLMERLPPTVATIYLAVPSLTRDEMLAVIADDLGIETQGANTTKLIRALQARLIEIHAEGKQVVALVDEAHAMPMATLEEIRLLSNLETSQHKLMQIVLFGQPELDEHLSQPHMRQLKERITHAFNLRPLPERDIKDYLDFRLRAAGYKGPDLFSREALNLIAEASEGLTRRINIYADKTLLAAYAAGTHTITADHARAAINDTQIVPPPDKRGNRVWTAAGLGLAAGLAIGFFIGRQMLPPARVADAKQAQSSITPTAPQAAAPSSITTAQASQAATSPTTPLTAAPVKGRTDPPAADQATEGGDWLEARLLADRNRLASAAAGRWAIQLMTADQRERAAIEGYLKDARKVLDPDRIFLYQAGTIDLPRVGVIYGDFASRDEAQAGMATLPQRIGQFRPYVRSFQAVREDSRGRSAP